MQDKYGLRPRKVPKTKHKWLKRSLITIGILLLTVTVIFGSGAVYLLHINSKYTETVKLDLAKSPITQNIKIVDKNNQILSESINRAYYIPSTIKGDNKNIPDLYLKTLLATEDHNFYDRKTKGYDIKGITSAVISAIKSKLGHGTMRGGSTIDQQVVKTLMLGGSQAEESLQRKIVELLESHEMARTYSRDEILTAYIDSIRLTPDTIGVSAAYKALFNGDFNSKDSRSPENIAKEAFMAGLGQAPSSYVNDFNGLGKKRTKIVLQIMLEDNLISNKEYKDTLQYIDHDFTLSIKQGQREDDASQSYLVQVHNEMAKLNLPTYADVTIKTYADINQLHKLKEIVDFKDAPVTQMESQVMPEGGLNAISVVDTKTGHILGLATNAKNPLTPVTSERSSGSSIKPLLDYAPAIEFAGINAGSILNGNNTAYSDGTPLRNYGLYQYGAVNASYALGNSLNTAAYQAFMMTNLQQKNAIMRPLNIAKGSYMESESLGLNISTLKEASAYQAIGNDGVHIEARAISNVDVDGKAWPIPKPKVERAMSSSTSKTLIQMMQGVTAANGSEPKAAQPQWPNAFAAKSGLVGFDDEITAKVTAKYGNVMPSSDAWMAATSSGVSVSAWVGTPDFSGNTFIIGGGNQPENNARVYLLNNTIRYMNPEKLEPFTYSGETLNPTTLTRALPDVPNNANDTIYKDAKGFKAPTPKVDTSLKAFKEAHKDDKLVDANTIYSGN